MDALLRFVTAITAETANWLQLQRAPTAGAATAPPKGGVQYCLHPLRVGCTARGFCSEYTRLNVNRAATLSPSLRVVADMSGSVTD